MIRSSAAASLVIVLLASAASADEFRTFYVDPARSHMRFDSGSIAFNLTGTAYPFGPLTPQSGVSATSAISGHFVASAGGDFSAPSFVFVLPGTADFRVANDNEVSPAPGGVSGTAPGAFAVTYADIGLVLGGDAALRDLRMVASGVFDIVSNPVGPYGLRGDFHWMVASGTADIRTSFGLSGTALLSGRLQQYGGAMLGFVYSDQSQVSEVSPGEYELLLPFGFGPSMFGMPGPFNGLNASGTIFGEIVASTIPVPEPGAASSLLASLLTLAAIRSTRRAP